MPSWIALAAALAAQSGDAPAALEERIEFLAADYANDPKRIADLTLGIEVDGEAWTVRPNAERSGYDVVSGRPEADALVFVTDAETFDRIFAGDMTMSTALVQARSSDWTPVTIDFIGDVRERADLTAWARSQITHFFTTGQPEIIRFGHEHSRVAHGGDANPLFYGDGLRSSWYGVRPGQHVNEEERDQVNNFDSVFVIIKAGDMQARIGGEEIDLETGISIYVPEGMAHEFWNDGEEPGEFILMMFGGDA